MRNKYYILFGALSVAFVAVSLWVALSGGKSARAVRAKFRIGGLMLSISSLLAFASCETDKVHPIIDCYDPVPPERIIFVDSNQNEVTVGNAIEFSVDGPTYASYSYHIQGANGEMVQSGTFELTGRIGTIVIADTDYRGYISLTIYGKGEADDGSEQYLGNKNFLLK